MFVGRDPQTNVGSILGSGFIVGTNGQILVLSAAHIFVDWVERVRPSAPHALRGLVGDAEDFRDRFMRTLGKLQTLHAVLDLGHAGGPRVATIGSVGPNHD
jgi:hypothetical protein